MYGNMQSGVTEYRVEPSSLYYLCLYKLGGDAYDNIPDYKLIVFRRYVLDRIADLYKSIEIKRPILLA